MLRIVVAAVIVTVHAADCICDVMIGIRDGDLWRMTSTSGRVETVEVPWAMRSLHAQGLIQLLLLLSWRSLRQRVIGGVAAAEG